MTHTDAIQAVIDGETGVYHILSPDFYKNHPGLCPGDPANDLSALPHGCIIPYGRFVPYSRERFQSIAVAGAIGFCAFLACMLIVRAMIIHAGVVS